MRRMLECSRTCKGQWSGLTEEKGGGRADKVRQESSWTLMFADDVICSESKEQMEEKLERWSSVLERRTMNLCKYFIIRKQALTD